MEFSEQSAGSWEEARRGIRSLHAGGWAAVLTRRDGPQQAWKAQSRAVVKDSLPSEPKPRLEKKQKSLHHAPSQPNRFLRKTSAGWWPQQSLFLAEATRQREPPADVEQDRGVVSTHEEVQGSDSRVQGRQDQRTAFIAWPTRTRRAGRIRGRSEFKPKRSRRRFQHLALQKLRDRWTNLQAIKWLVKHEEPQWQWKRKPDH